MIKTAWVLVLAIVAAFPASLEAQWTRAYGGKNDDDATSIQPAPEGGFIMVGTSGYMDRWGGWVPQIWVVRLNVSGAILWQKRMHAELGCDQSYGACVQTTRDDRFVLTGRVYARSLSGMGNLSAVKLDANGDPDWQTYVTEPGYPDERRWSGGHSIQQTWDGGYIATGLHVYEQWDPVLAKASFSRHDLLIYKTDSQGKRKCGGTFGGDGEERGHSILETPDGGFLVAGVTDSFGAGADDALVLKLGKTGNIDTSCGLFVRNSKAEIREGAGRAEWKAGEGGCGYIPWSIKPLLPWLFTSAANTVICKK
ncbi:MAG: hypothetical protein JW742_04210 [Candidatus Aminicenantes bacterium]|nr:hypothetical protein [Candidatus Aminicenantes bacterium]